ncbi:glycosyltransferase involved in cell wall biosynthesis [Arcticibacter pallidicorallinus]|uniref:Glycosyltransferase involved in cell wall biosynthesis n=1 Tax=Arcticibacter pallidicorallinus TaxID=1259464 RepID=A0A2T0U9L9_9SPHI|nr:glycosyltransferase family 1 protein [Arcticibacter pallidicorallinus]PRY54572.1 glycosyltransferase involved in cell wall biosynthesis [Arcticibacter pallidicorallinus]
MKIIFICGSLEDGKDGVGDYTRRLGKKLVENGYSVGIIALHDKHLDTKLWEEEGDSSFRTLRLSTRLSWKRRGTLSADLIKEVDPVWISLQFVGFAYHRYGLPLGMISLVKKLSDSRYLHIMFHELWCGMSASAPPKEVVLGKLQYWFLRLMLASLKPREVFTNIERYQDRLQQLGVQPLLVPVFSNIPLASRVSEESWDAVIAKSGLQPLLRGSENRLVLGFFGSIYPIAGFKALIKNAYEAAGVLGRECCVVLIGNSSKEDLARLSGCSLPMRVFELGMQSAGIINRAMDLVDFGVVTTPVDGINKSGGAAAWIERGIPILVSGEDPTDKGHNLQAAFGAYRVTCEGDVVEACLQPGWNREKKERLDSVAEVYMRHF